MQGQVSAGGVSASKDGLAVVCDLDGVVYLGRQPVPGAGEALGRLGRMGVAVVFATNNATKTPQHIASIINDAVGIAVDPAAVVTSAMAAVGLIEKGPVMVVGEAGLEATAQSAGLALTEDPGESAAVIVGLDRGISYDRLRSATTAILGGARFVATNTDATFPTPEGLWPGGGAIVAAIETATGVRPTIAGKPHSPMAEAVRSRIGERAVVVVGDRPETDIELGRRAGWTTVLVETGVTAPGATADPAPDHRIASLADLPDLIDQIG